MSTTNSPIATEPQTTTHAKNQKAIDNHKMAAKHLEEAAKHHLEAVKHHEAGNQEKASKSTITAHGHHVLATDAQREVSKHHALHI